MEKRMKNNTKKKWSILLIFTIMASMPIANFPSNAKAQEESQDTVIYGTKQDYEDAQEVIVMTEDKNQDLDVDGVQTEELTDKIQLVTVKDGEDTEEVMEELAQAEEVVSIQPNYTYTAITLTNEEDTTTQEPTEPTTPTEPVIPNDPSFSKQWGLHNDGTLSFPSIEKRGANVKEKEDVDINAPEAWANYTVSGRETIVAVIDTGIDYRHEDLNKAMWKNPKEIMGNGIDDDNNGYVDDIYGWDFFHNDNTICHYNSARKASALDNDDHGTHCAGIIAATANNGKGVAGVASNANVKIMSVKALGGAKGEGNTATMIKAIRYAVRNGADVINLSCGGEPDKYDKALETAIRESGVLFVVAAGNEGNNNDEHRVSPACYSYLDNVITVGFVNCNGTISKYSNYGQSVNILAPGVYIYSTIVGDYDYMSGSSMATPVVTGVAAMLYSTKDNLYPKVVKDAILNYYKPLSQVSEDKAENPGIVDAYAAIKNRKRLTVDTQAPVFTKVQSNYKGKVVLTATDTAPFGELPSKICNIRYASGVRTAANFKRGTLGTKINSGTFTVKNSGTYTIYVRDNAGNETVKTIKVTVDKQAPKVAASVKNRTISLSISDNLSGLKVAKYAYGKQSLSYFKNGSKGTTLKVSGTKATIKSKQKGTVTVYVRDKADNQRVVYYTVK